jgi:hypothetical protein
MILSGSNVLRLNCPLLLFYNREYTAEPEKRVAEINSGKGTLKEHELIEVDG